MMVHVFIGGEGLPDNGLQWAFSYTGGNWRFWSQLDYVISHYFNSTLESDVSVQRQMISNKLCCFNITVETFKCKTEVQTILN